jgi:hypothetical protein
VTAVAYCEQCEKCLDALRQALNMRAYISNQILTVDGSLRMIQAHLDADQAVGLALAAYDLHAERCKAVAP